VVWTVEMQATLRPCFFIQAGLRRRDVSLTVNNRELIIVACYYVVVKQPLPHSAALTDLSLSSSDLLRRRTEFLLFAGRASDAFSFSTRRWAQSASSGGGKGPNGSPHSTPICGSSSSCGSNCDVPSPTSTQISHYREHRPSFSSAGTVCLWTTEFDIELHVILTPPLPYMNVIWMWYLRCTEIHCFVYS